MSDTSKVINIMACDKGGNWQMFVANVSVAGFITFRAFMKMHPDYGYKVVDGDGNEIDLNLEGEQS